jgi:hypothetical protein
MIDDITLEEMDFVLRYRAGTLIVGKDSAEQRDALHQAGINVGWVDALRWFAEILGDHVRGADRYSSLFPTADALNKMLGDKLRELQGGTSGPQPEGAGADSEEDVRRGESSDASAEQAVREALDYGEV